jgi:hypothetical protein
LQELQNKTGIVPGADYLRCDVFSEAERGAGHGGFFMNEVGRRKITQGTNGSTAT